MMTRKEKIELSKYRKMRSKQLRKEGFTNEEISLILGVTKGSIYSFIGNEKNNKRLDKEEFCRRWNEIPSHQIIVRLMHLISRGEKG